MRTPQELNLLRKHAVILRRQGKSRSQIKQILGPMSNSTLNNALKNEPPPEWTLRPNAKDELRASARELRGQGLDYEEIAAALGVAKSSVSLWVRDLPTPAAAELRGMQEAIGRRRSPLLGSRASRPRGAPRCGPRGRRRRDRRVDRSRDPHRRRHRLLVRRLEEQAVPAQRPRRLHEQRPVADPVLPAVPRHDRDSPDRPDLPRLYPRERRCGIGPAVLAGGYRRVAGSVPHPDAEAPQPEDRAEERGRRTITAACASTSAAAQTSTARSKAGQKRS